METKKHAGCLRKVQEYRVSHTHRDRGQAKVMAMVMAKCRPIRRGYPPGPWYKQTDLSGITIHGYNCDVLMSGEGTLTLLVIGVVGLVFLDHGSGRKSQRSSGLARQRGAAGTAATV